MPDTNNPNIILEGGETMGLTFSLTDPDNNDTLIDTTGYSAKFWVRTSRDNAGTLVLSTEAPASNVTATFAYVEGAYSTVSFEATAAVIANLSPRRYYYQWALIDSGGGVEKSPVYNLVIRADQA